jgi:hypothetical protein
MKHVCRLQGSITPNMGTIGPILDHENELIDIFNPFLGLFQINDDSCNNKIWNPFYLKLKMLWCQGLDKPRNRHGEIALHVLPTKPMCFQSLLVEQTTTKTITICSSRWTQLLHHLIQSTQKKIDIFNYHWFYYFPNMVQMTEHL